MMKKDDPAAQRALRLLCDIAGDQAESQRFGKSKHWTAAREASLEELGWSLPKVGLALGTSLLALGVLATQFDDEPIAIKAVERDPAPSAAWFMPALTRSVEQPVSPAIAPVAAATSLGVANPLPQAPTIEPEEPAVPSTPESLSQPDGSC